jgi:hypothetical protein
LDAGVADEASVLGVGEELGLAGCVVKLGEVASPPPLAPSPSWLAEFEAAHHAGSRTANPVMRHETESPAKPGRFNPGRVEFGAAMRS